MKTLTRSLLILMFISGTMAWSKLYASHTAGMELLYRHITANTYEFTMTFYRNCLGGTATAPNSITLLAQSNSLGFTNRTAGTLLQIPGTGTQPPNLYNCTGANLCYEEYVYRGTINLNTINPSNPNARDWVFYYHLCCRPTNPAPDNIDNGQQYVECGLNNKDFSGNNSPFWHNSRPNFPAPNNNDTIINALMRTMCADNFYTFEQNVNEYDGDKVTYEFIKPSDWDNITQSRIDENYKPGYSLANPLPFYAPPAGPGFNIDANGIINVIPQPSTDNVFVITIKATEYRPDTVVVNGTLTPIYKEIGYVIRDMTLFIDDQFTCKRDSVHPKPVNVKCGDSTLTVRFQSAPNDWSRVRCATLSPDGSEFRVMDSTVVPARPIGILEASWNCGSGQNTERVDLKLAERLHYDHDYYLFVKTGSDLDVIESECGFLEPEFSGVKLKLNGKTPVDLGLPPSIAVCLPQEDPFPVLKGASTKAVDYYWTFNGDTIQGQNTDSIWAQEEGDYKILVRGPYGCPGSDNVKVYFPKSPEFVFDLPPYCDESFTPDNKNLPKVLTVPADPTGGTWEWEYDFGPPNGFDLIHTGDSLIPIGPGRYKITYTDTSYAPGVPGCVSEYEFVFNRASHPPEAPLNVEIWGDPILCEQGGGEAFLYVVDTILKPNFKAKPGYGPNTPYEYQWFNHSLQQEIVGAVDSTLITANEGFYYLVVKDQYGCVGVDSVQIERIGRTPAFEVFCQVLGGKTGRFYWYDQPFAVSYEVSADEGITWVPVQGNFFDVEDIRITNSILVRAVLSNVCELSDVSTSYPCAADVFPPNVFTPNGDGLNDVFFIGSLDLFPESTVKIFDRWGTVVYESEDYKNDWDGGDSPEGTYYYIVNVNDPAQSVYRGIVTLLR